VGAFFSLHNKTCRLTQRERERKCLGEEEDSMAGADDGSVGEEEAVESDDSVEVESSAVSFDRLRFVDRVHGGYDESRTKCPGPHLLYTAL